MAKSKSNQKENSLKITFKCLNDITMFVTISAFFSPGTKKQKGVGTRK